MTVYSAIIKYTHIFRINFIQYPIGECPVTLQNENEQYSCNYKNGQKIVKIQVARETEPAPNCKSDNLNKLRKKLKS